MKSQGENTDTQRTREALLALAHSASRYLRRSASPAVRLAAALLLAASLAACNASASDPTMVQSQQVTPLTQEVSVGLPRGPGSYEVVSGSIFRDQQGVYQFEWFDQSQGAAAGQVARESRLRLLRDPRLYLEIAPGSDPVLHLPETEHVGLTQQAQASALQAGPAYYPPVYTWWSPFYGYGYGSAWYPHPAYYDPPRTVIVAQSPSSTSGGASAPSVSGGTISETAKPPAMRVTGVQSAVSGRAGGTGAGNAVTSRNASSGASSGSSASGSAGAAASSSGSSGSSAGGAASGASSGVSAPRSGGFSGGTGSSGGSSVS